MRKTEMRNENTMHIDEAATLEMVQMMNRENYNAVAAVERESENIARVIDAVAAAYAKGGRMFYIGCGTSGRIAVMDAAECPPTFGVPYDRVVAIIAGGEKCMVKAAEGEEDSAEQGVADLKAHNLTERDSVIGISASGGANYVVAALEYANAVGCITVSITSNAGSKMDGVAKFSINPDTGAEVITGSTRLKAGTAQKLILNMISTCVMVKQGYVRENLMINLRPTNIKLRDRVIRITCDLSGKSYEAAEAALEQTDWSIRNALSVLEGE